ncbi:MAG: septum formation initiator family protein [Actinomycetota bacterium]
MTQAVSRARPRVSLRAAVLAALVTAILIAGVFPIRTYLSERARIAELSRQAQVLEQRNHTLARRIDQLHSDDYIERLARECLGMVKPGEVAFVLVPHGGKGPKPAPC